MTSLTVLNLSDTGIARLPNSSNLECLVTLWLHGCIVLRYVPSLAKLRKLMWLNLCRTAITEVPQGLEMLINLRWLGLRKTRTSFDFTKLTKLQSLHLNCTPGSMDVKAQDLRSLKRLESISAHFCDISEFNAYVESFLQKRRRLFSYYFGLGTKKKAFYDKYELIEGYDTKVIKLIGSFLDCPNIVLPNDATQLIITEYNYGQRRCLCDFFYFYIDEPCIIELCEITLCDNLNFLFCTSVLCPFCPSLKLVGSLILRDLKGLHILCKDSEVVLGASSFPPTTFFYCLKYLRIERCNDMKKLLTPELSAQLQNLENIFVADCKSMEEIFSIRSREQEDEQLLDGGNHFEHTITLPKLQSMCLVNLPELHFVCKGMMICHSLTTLKIRDCGNLKSLPEFQPAIQKQSFEYRWVTYTFQKDNSNKPFGYR